MIDRIFTHSTSLNSEAIVDFVTHLCAVSEHELNNEAGPRVFLLQKIVEITFYNMSRVRYVWSRIWNILAKHFTVAGLTSFCSFIVLYSFDGESPPDHSFFACLDQVVTKIST